MNTSPSDLADTVIPALERDIRSGEIGLVPLSSVRETISFLESLPVLGRQHLRDAIIREPMAIALLLQMANTRYVDPVGHGISSLDTALDLVGEAGVFRILNELAHRTPEHWRWEFAPQQLRKYWTNTMYTALAAQELAVRTKVAAPDTAFSAAVLHNIGESLIVQHLALKFQHVGALHTALPQVAKLLASYHPHIGALALRTWNIPRAIVQVAGQHHEQTSSSLCSTVSAAWQGALHYGYSYLGARPDTAALEFHMKQLRLRPSVLNDITQEIAGALNQMLSRRF